MSHEAEPDSEETPWGCVSLEKNVDSFLYPKVQTPTESNDQSNGLTFLRAAEVIFILFFIGIIVGAVVFFAKRALFIRSLFHRSPGRRGKNAFFSVRFAKKSLIDEIDE